MLLRDEGMRQTECCYNVGLLYLQVKSCLPLDYVRVVLRLGLPFMVVTNPAKSCLLRFLALDCFFCLLTATTGTWFADRHSNVTPLLVSSGDSTE